MAATRKKFSVKRSVGIAMQPDQLGSLGSLKNFEAVALVHEYLFNNWHFEIS